MKHPRILKELLVPVGSIAIALASLAASPGGHVLGVLETSTWSPPSPDPAGIVYSPARNSLLVSDSEVDEMRRLFAGANLFEVVANGNVVATFDLRSFTSEPTGVAVSDTGRIFFSDDDQALIFEVHPGSDGFPGTSDDVVRLIDTTAFGCIDPEDVAFGDGKLFVVDGVGHMVFVLDPGPNRVFDGGGDDVISQFDTDPLGAFDFEGIAYHPGAGTLFLVGAGAPVIETTTTGVFVRALDISDVQPLRPNGITWGPSRSNPARPSLYIVDRGIDNDEDAQENDGRLFEIDPALAPPPSNLIANPGFEVDLDGNSRPDHWTEKTSFTRSSEAVFNGSHAGRFAAAATVRQTVVRLAGGEAYDVAGWVNVPPTTASVVFRIQVRWFNANGTVLSTQTVGSVQAATAGWSRLARAFVAPENTTHADVLLFAETLNGTVYVDDVSFGPPGVTPTPTPTPSPTPTPTPLPYNLIENAGFEIDANLDGSPDQWSPPGILFTRSNAVVRGGGFSGRLFSTSNSKATITQTLSGIAAGTTYAFTGWVNVPFTTDSFNFKFRIAWLDAGRQLLTTTTLATYRKPTGGWSLTSQTVAAPAGAVQAEAQIVVSSLKATIYVDDLDFRRH